MFGLPFNRQKILVSKSNSILQWGYGLFQSSWSTLLFSILCSFFLHNLCFPVLASFLMSRSLFLHSILTNGTVDGVIKEKSDEVGEGFISLSQMVDFFLFITKSCLFLRWLLCFALLCVCVCTCVLVCTTCSCFMGSVPIHNSVWEL